MQDSEHIKLIKILRHLSLEDLEYYKGRIEDMMEELKTKAERDALIQKFMNAEL